MVGSCCAVCYVKKGAAGILPPHLEELYNNINKDLDSEQRRMFMELLFEFQDAFTSSPNGFGRTNVTKHTIDTGGARPIRQTPRRLPLAKQENAQVEVETMLKHGVIEPSAATVLVSPGSGGDFIVDTDASDVGIGCVLSHW